MSSGLGPRLKYRWHPSAAQPFTLVVAQRTSAQPLGSSNHSAFYIQVAQLCFEAALPLVEKEAAAGGDASAASLQLGCTRAFERLHASAAAVSDRAGVPHAIQPRFASLHTHPSYVCVSGTTLTVVAWNRARAELTVAHAGDSVALLVEGTAAAGQARPLPSLSPSTQAGIC